MTQAQLYLASTSPRRRQLLAQLGLSFEVLPIDIEEAVQPDEAPADYVCRVAVDKAHAGWQHAQRQHDLPVLGADTAVIIDGEVLGKPQDGEHALSMLRRLSGRRHEVLSAVALVRRDRCQVMLNRSRVSMSMLDEQTLLAYWQTGEPVGKAGGYAIQGLAAAFISHLEGSFSGVMGLPLHETAELLQEFDVKWLQNQ